jgi:hypothetical protein
MTYHNTTPVQGEQLELFTNRAKRQDEEVMDVFCIIKSASPSSIYKLLKEKYPITSIRRSITNLTNQGRLAKTEKFVEGMYGRPERVWAKLSEL